MSITNSLERIAGALQIIALHMENPVVGDEMPTDPLIKLSETEEKTPFIHTPVITIESLNELCIQVAEMMGDKGAGVIEILKGFGVGSISELEPDKYAEFKEIIEGLEK